MCLVKCQDFRLSKMTWNLFFISSVSELWFSCHGNGTTTRHFQINSKIFHDKPREISRNNDTRKQKIKIAQTVSHEKFPEMRSCNVPFSSFSEFDFSEIFSHSENHSFEAEISASSSTEALFEAITKNKQATWKVFRLVKLKIATSGRNGQRIRIPRKAFQKQQPKLADWAEPSREEQQQPKYKVHAA